MASAVVKPAAVKAKAKPPKHYTEVRHAPSTKSSGPSGFAVPRRIGRFTVT